MEDIWVINQENKATCPYCNNTNLRDSDYVIRETGSVIASWHDFFCCTFCCKIYHVRCHKKVLNVEKVSFRCGNAGT